MTREIYSIREAAEILGVEAHALRFWEEELGLEIGRNGQGRRVYSEENMQVFQKIMSWKEQGMQLKMIRTMLHPEEVVQDDNALDANRRIIMYRPRENTGVEMNAMAWGQAESDSIEQSEERNLTCVHTASEMERAEKSRRLQELLKQFISESIRESNAELMQMLREGLIKELDYQFRLQEEREEEREKIRIEKEDEHFRQLDENIRSAMERRGRKKKRSLLR